MGLLSSISITLMVFAAVTLGDRVNTLSDTLDDLGDKLSYAPASLGLDVRYADSINFVAVAEATSPRTPEQGLNQSAELDWLSGKVGAVVAAYYEGDDVPTFISVCREIREKGFVLIVAFAHDGRSVQKTSRLQAKEAALLIAPYADYYLEGWRHSPRYENDMLNKAQSVNDVPCIAGVLFSRTMFADVKSFGRPTVTYGLSLGVAENIANAIPLVYDYPTLSEKLTVANTLFSHGKSAVILAGRGHLPATSLSMPDIDQLTYTRWRDL